MRGWIGVMILMLPVSAWAREPILVARSQPAVRTAGEMLVKYKTGSIQAQSLAGGSGLAALGIARVPMAAGQTLRAQTAQWSRRADVEWAQPNEWRYAQATEIVPNDPYYLPQRNQRRYQQWYLPRINANYAWSLGKGNDGLIAAVVDTGVDLNHPDLRGRLLPGITVVNQSGYSAPADGMDDNGHGTHVAGLIAAETDNNLGVAGCAWTGRIMPVKVLNCDGAGTDADIAAGITWAADHGARIINLSLGGPSEGDEVPAALQAAVDYAYAKGCLVTAAAGNSGDHQVMFPAALDHVTAIAATDQWDRRASYSTLGSYVALAAPGGADTPTLETGILSTYWDSSSYATDGIGGSEAGEYAVMAGTSMAAAVASGAALVLWSQNPGWTVDQVVNALKDSAVDIGPTGPDQESGAGRIDLLAALGNPSVTQSELTSYAYPNPFSPEKDGVTHIVFLLDRPTGVKLSIFDVSRDLVWRQEIAAGDTVAGKNIKQWDGRNGVGRTVANGAYYFRVTTDDGRSGKTKIIAVLR